MRTHCVTFPGEVRGSAAHSGGTPTDQRDCVIQAQLPAEAVGLLGLLGRAWMTLRQLHHQKALPPHRDNSPDAYPGHQPLPTGLQDQIRGGQRENIAELSGKGLMSSYKRMVMVITL